MIKAILKDERAVSPVIGVMLMVVVTIILAAVVSGFASDMGTTEKAPSASFSVDITKSGTGMADHVMITQLAGPSINTTDLKALFTFDGTTTEVEATPVAYYSSYSSAFSDYDAAPLWTYNQTGSGTGENTGTLGMGNYSISSGLPMKGCGYDTSWGYLVGWNSTTDSFTDADLTNDSFKDTYGNVCDDVHYLIRNWDDLSAGDYVNVKLVHTPSGRVLLDVDTEVKGAN